MARRKDTIIDKSTNQGMLFLQPYFGMLLVAILAIGLFLVSLRGYKLQIELAMAASTILLSWFTWKASQRRRDFGRWHAVISMLGAGGWIIAAIEFMIKDPATIFLVWLLGGLTLGLTWNIRHATRPESRQDAMDMFFEELGLEGTKMKTTSKTKDIIKATISLKRGKGEVEQLQKTKGKFASLFGAPPNGVRIMPDSENASRAFMTIVTRDMLKRVTQYEWKPQSGLTPNDPMIIGVYEDAEPLQFSLHSKDLGGAHMLIQGMNGAGKSEMAKVLFAEAFKRMELELWIIDTTKGSQTLGLIKDAADWVIDNEKIADLLFKKFSKVIKARADFLGNKRLTKWEPGCGLSFIYMHIEEASGLVADNPAFIKMMETARSVGITIITSLQRASFVSIDIAARAQFSAVTCFGVSEIRDAMFALPDEVMDAGANPAIWRNSKPGYCYLVHPTISDEKWITPARTNSISDDVLVYAAANRVTNELDHVTLGALGDLYQAEMDDDPDNDEEETEEMFTSEEWKEVEELESEYDVILDFDKLPVLSPAEAKKVFEDRLEDLKATNSGEFNAPELGDVLVQTGRSRAWIHQLLQKKVEEGVLDKDGFTYKFL